MQRKLLAIGLTVLLLSSGCLGFVQGTTPLSFEANPVVVSDGALEEAGYGNETLTDVRMNRSVTFQNQTREVEVVNWNTQYEKSVGIGPIEQKAAMFATFSTPELALFGQSFNPVANMTNREVLQHALSETAGLNNVTHVEDRNAVVLGKGATVSTFTATVQSGGQYLVAYEQDIALHVTKVNHEGDYVIVVAAHPVQMDETETLIRLMESLEHSDR